MQQHASAASAALDREGAKIRSTEARDEVSDATRARVRTVAEQICSHILAKDSTRRRKTCATPQWSAVQGAAALFPPPILHQ
mmetsp:Transcript_7200/g.19297  ORF Transcript_7200/g.19297 Transcript_7200/m.19297 type:complete len:82 (-) Transcript_7200:597-842(-)